MKQHSLGLGATAKRTRRREFLDEMERVVPWGELVALVTPYLPEGKRGRPPFAPETMLRIHFMQQWFNLSDPAMEEALHDVPLFREFAGLGTWDDRLPDESTILRFRHVLEKHKLAPHMLHTVNELLTAKGLLLKSGTVVDATLIAAPSSTKNASGERDPEMKQSRKGQQWYFGMKAHIGVDAESGLVHTVRGTAGSVNDVIEANSLLHGQESDAFGDAGYQGAGKRPDARAGVNWHIAMRPWQAQGTGQDQARGPTDRAGRAHQGPHPGQGRAPIPGDQAPVRPRQGALPRTGQEHGAVAHAVRAGQPVAGAPAPDGSRGMSAPEIGKSLGKARQIGAQVGGLKPFRAPRASDSVFFSAPAHRDLLCADHP
jgi:IS5 family transposase